MEQQRAIADITVERNTRDQRADLKYRLEQAHHLKNSARAQGDRDMQEAAADEIASLEQQLVGIADLPIGDETTRHIIDAPVDATEVPPHGNA